eukprot:gene36061-44471_t
MALSNLKIGARLGVGFAIVLALLTAMLVLGLSSLSRIGSRTQDIVSDKNVKMAAANDLVDNVRSISLALTTMIVVPDTASMNTELAKIAEARKKYGVARETMMKLLSDDKERQLMAAVDEALKSGAAKNNELVRLRKDGEVQDATEFLLKETGPSLNAVLAALDAFVDYESKLASDAAIDVEQVYRSSQILMLVLGIAGIAIGAGVAWFITRSITGPLNKAVDLAETVASGDLSSHIEEQAGNLATVVGFFKTGTQAAVAPAPRR